MYGHARTHAHTNARTHTHTLVFYEGILQELIYVVSS